MWTPEERDKYRAKCEEVARKLYGLDKINYTRWEDASPNVREKWIYQAHMSRVWWNLENGHFFIDVEKEEQ